MGSSGTVPVMTDTQSRAERLVLLRSIIANQQYTAAQAREVATVAVASAEQAETRLNRLRERYLDVLAEHEQETTP